MKSGLKIFGVLAFAGLAACGGGTSETPLTNGGGAGGNEQTLIFPEFVGADKGRMNDAVLRDELQTVLNLVNRLDDVNQTPPVAAQATMDGTVLLTRPSNETIIGNLTLNANFANETFGGATSDFGRYRDSTEFFLIEPLDGALRISNGQISGGGQTDAFLGADLDGSLVGNRGTYTIDGEMFGVFSTWEGRHNAFGIISGTQTETSAGGNTSTINLVNSSFFAVD